MTGMVSGAFSRFLTVMVPKQKDGCAKVWQDCFRFHDSLNKCHQASSHTTNIFYNPLSFAELLMVESANTSGESWDDGCGDFEGSDREEALYPSESSGATASNTATTLVTPQRRRESWRPWIISAILLSVIGVFGANFGRHFWVTNLSSSSPQPLRVLQDFPKLPGGGPKKGPRGCDSLPFWGPNSDGRDPCFYDETQRPEIIDEGLDKPLGTTDPPAGAPRHPHRRRHMAAGV